MIFAARIFFAWFVFALFAVPLLPAQTISTWSLSGSVETAYGYNDNLLLSHAEEERSAFARGRAEIALINLPQGAFDYSMLGEVIGTHYFSGKTIDHEASAFLYMEPGYRVADSLKISLPFTGYYRDEVLDVSDTDVERLIAAWKLWGGGVAPTVRWSFLPNWWIEASANGERTLYEDHSEDSHLGVGEVRLNWKLTPRIDLRLAGTRSWRNFDNRAQYSAVGREVVGTKLKTARREGTLRVDIAWDAAKHWTTSTRASAMQYRDNGSGFFNYNEKSVSQNLEWKTERWLVRLEGTAGRLDFDVQTVGLGIDPPPLLKDHYFGEARIERILSPRWTIFGGYTWERRRSNDPIVSYVVNEGLLGLRWSWDK